MLLKKRNWLFAFLLTIPVLVFIAAYFLKASHGLVAPGFLLHDNVSYVAYAKEYIDTDKFSLEYSNPFNESGSYPKIYFQFQNFIFLILLKIGIAPGWTILIFTWFFSLITFRVIISIYDHLVPKGKNRILSIIFFGWGGGLLVLAGISGQAFTHIDGIDKLDKLFVLDPSWGWWGLNLGRSLFFGTEAYYHALFFGGICCIMKQNWKSAILLAFVLSFSHPFSGIQYLSIINAWLLVEILLKKNKSIPAWFGVTMFILMCIHIYYYLIYLNRFPEHKSVSEQYSINWHLRYYNMLFAYFITGFLAIFSVFRLQPVKIFFANSKNRLFTCWFVVSMLLANHELFIKPMQPIHFTRGYIWSSLFLMGIPALEYILNFLKKKQHKFLIISTVALLFLSDNMVWVINYSRKNTQTHLSVYISKDEKKVLDWLEQNSSDKTLIVSSDQPISYLSTVYTKAYPWISHIFTTPFYSEKKELLNDFILYNKIPISWYNKELIFIFNSNDSLEVKRSVSLISKADTAIKMNNFVIVKSRFIK